MSTQLWETTCPFETWLALQGLWATLGWGWVSRG